VHFLYLLPRTACSVSIYLLALHVAVLCMRSRPFDAVPVKAADLRSQHSLSVFHLTTSPWSSLHVIHLSTIDTTRMQSFCTIFLVPMTSLLSVTLLPRLPLSFGLSVSYPPFYPMSQHTHVLHLHNRIPYIVSKPRSAFQKAPALYAERTSLHLLDPVPPICFVRFDLSSSLPFVLWDLSIGKGRK
jgi:hypothetical protein